MASDMIVINTLYCKPFLAVRAGKTDEVWTMNLVMIFKCILSVEHLCTEVARQVDSLHMLIGVFPVIPVPYISACMNISVKELIGPVRKLFPMFALNLFVLFSSFISQEQGIRVLPCKMAFHVFYSVGGERAEITLENILPQFFVMPWIMALEIIGELEGTITARNTASPNTTNTTCFKT